MACLSHDTVVALLDGRLDAAAAAEVDGHMDVCPPCRELVAQVARASASRVGRVAAHAVGDAESLAESDDSASTELLAGERVADRFRIVRPVGRGAMGVVYEAEDLTLKTRVALKMLPPEAATMPALLKRLQQEVVLGRRITHPNVCRLHDFGDASGRPFVSMEFVEGETLKQVLGRGPVAPERAVEILDQIARALEAAHAHGVVHRDLKPANVMVDAAGKVTVMDFGLARDLRADRSERGILVGTPAYWSPEQSRGEKATTRSDLYTLGVVACEVFGGPRPTWESELDLAAVPAAYAGLIRACLQHDPALRPESASAFRRALFGGGAVDRRGRSEKSDGARRPALPVRPYRRRFVVLALALGALLGAVLVWLLAGSRQEPNARRGDSGGGLSATRSGAGPVGSAPALAPSAPSAAAPPGLPGLGDAGATQARAPIQPPPRVGVRSPGSAARPASATPASVVPDAGPRPGLEFFE